MANAPPAWDLYRSFLAVLRLGSLSAAARELELTQPTLGRHIQELEASLGLALFVRSQTGLAPTDSARQLKPHAEAMAAAAGAFARAATGAADESKGSVRLTASEFVGVEILPPLLARFRQSHPRIAIELSLSNLNQDLSRRDADIAIRMTRPTQAALVARKLGLVRIALYAHRVYLARHGMPKSLGDLAHHSVIGFDADTTALRAYRQTGLAVTREMFALRTDSEHAQLAALRAGFGIGGCQTGIAARNPDLVAVLPKAFGVPLEMWLVMHEDLRGSRRVRLLYDHLAESLTAYIREAKPAGRASDGLQKPQKAKTRANPKKK
jgi:DNA-binding transcriptional LysR family regulator